MGFLVESYLDEDGVITMNACFVEVITHVGDFYHVPSRQQITEDTIEVLSSDSRFIKWKKNDVDKDNFMLFYEGYYGYTNNTILSERYKRLYCVENSEWRVRNSVPKNMNPEHDFVINDDTNCRYHYFESLDSYNELFSIVFESFSL